MGRLIYSLNVSLDGFVEGPDHSLDWANVDDELHTWFNEQTRSLGASLYGRRMYQLMQGYWPSAETDPAATAPAREFARIWRKLPKVVFSTTLDRVEGNAMLVRGDVRERLVEVRARYSGDLDVGGATLAAELLRQGLVDELHPVVHPVVVGGGTPFLPPSDRPMPLRLLDTRRFATGAVALRYAIDRG